jgi:hypothetical protein
MPFTPSHAIVALPFIRTPLVPAAVAMGAMAPDVPLFARGFVLRYSQTHDPRWLPATMLLALGMLLVWRCLIRPVARELSPTWLAKRLPEQWDRGAVGALRDTFAVSAVRDPGRRQRWRVSGISLVWLVVALAIGVLSHILWDDFTHEGRAGVVALPALNEQWGRLLGYKWLQYGSSVVGVVILVVWAARWLSRRDAAASAPRMLPYGVRWVWWLSLPVWLGVAWTREVAANGLDRPHAVEIAAYSVLPPACWQWAVTSLVLCIVLQVVRALRPAPRRAVESGDA